VPTPLVFISYTEPDAAVRLEGPVAPGSCKGRMPGVAKEALEAKNAGNAVYLAACSPHLKAGEQACP